MLRDKTVSISLNKEEYEELMDRAKYAHLRLAPYCRTYLFTENVIAFERHDMNIKRIKKSKAPPDPYIEEKKKTHAIFRKDVKGELTEALSSGRHLKPIPKKEVKDMKERKEERKHEINKAQKIIKKKNIKEGVDDDW